MEISNKKLDIYKLTKAEKRIMEVCMNIELTSKNTLEKCKFAQTSRETWYTAMRKPEFVALLNAATMDMLKGKMGDLVNATYKFATTDSRCSADRKILLTMAGLYTDKQEIKADVDCEVNVTMSKELESWSH